MDLVEMLADPGQRQVVVAGTAAVFGVGKRVFDTCRMIRFTGLNYKIKSTLDSNEASREFYRSAKIANYVNCASIAIPTGMGIEAAWKSSAPLADNYFVEGISDLGAAAAGFGLGYVAIPVMIMSIGGIINGASRIFGKRR